MPYDRVKVHGHRLTRERCEQILERLAAMPLAKRREAPGLHPDRAPTIVAGGIILVEALDLFGLDPVEVSESDILDGAALEEKRNTNLKNNWKYLQDVRRASGDNGL